MYNQPFLGALKAISPDRIQQGNGKKLPVAFLPTYFLQLRARLDHEQCPALIVNSISGCILSINLPAFEYLAMDAVGLSLLDFLGVQDINPQSVQCSWEKQKAQLTASLRNADGQPIQCKVDVSFVPDYSEWLIVRFITNPA